MISFSHYIYIIRQKGAVVNPLFVFFCLSDDFWFEVKICIEEVRNEIFDDVGGDFNIVCKFLEVDDLKLVFGEEFEEFD